MRRKILSQFFSMHAHQQSRKTYGDVVCHECNEAAGPHQHICNDGGDEMPQFLLPRDRVTLLYNPACKHTLKSKRQLMGLLSLHNRFIVQRDQMTHSINICLDVSGSIIDNNILTEISSLFYTHNILHHASA